MQENNLDNCRIGFACKYVGGTERFRKRRNGSIITATRALELSEKECVETIRDIALHNIRCLRRLIRTTTDEDFNPDVPKRLNRMLRITSDLLPLYTHSKFEHIYQLPEVREPIQQKLLQVGNLARKYGFRLSFHPSQYTVLNSDKPHVVDNAIKDIEYQTELLYMMGYDLTLFHPHDLVINIHVGSKQGGKRRSIRRFKDNFQYLSLGAKNVLTVENDEHNYSIRDVLKLADTCAVVFDIHHEWCNTGKYLGINDPKIAEVYSSWKQYGRSARPKIHYSLPPKDQVDWQVTGFYENSNNNTKKYGKLARDSEDEIPSWFYRAFPDKSKLLERKSIADFRKHSNYMWHGGLNDHVLEFLPYFDIMVEAKMKNQASLDLIDRATELFSESEESEELE